MKNLISTRSKLYPFLVFMVCFALSVTAALTNLYNQQINQEAAFQEYAEEVRSLIENRLEVYANALISIKGLFNASEEVNREEFKNFIEAINLQDRYPGIQGVGFVPYVSNDKLEDLVISVREEGFNSFEITPPGERDIYAPVVFIEPLDERNQLALGYDMFSEETRRNALIKARDTGTAVMSGKVTLVQEFETGYQQPGFLLYVPYYLQESSTLREFQSSISGFMYSPFRSHDFMNALLLGKNIQIAFDIYDGRSTDEANLLYSYNNNLIGDNPLNVKNEIISLYGNEWTIVYRSTMQTDTSTYTRFTSLAILLVGTILGLLLSTVLYQQNNITTRAQRIAQINTHQLNASELFYKSIFLHYSDPVLVINRNGDIVKANYKASYMLDIPISILETSNIQKVYPDFNKTFIEDFGHDDDKFTIWETKYKTTYNKEKQIRLILKSLLIDKEIVIIAELHDVTEEFNTISLYQENERGIERLNKILIEREKKMIALKEEIKKLKQK